MKKFKKNLARYKGITNIELRIKDTIIEKIKQNMDRFERETKTLKTVMQTPRLRNSLKDFDLKG